MSTDASGNEKIAEQFDPAYEDNVRGVLARLTKPIIGASYSPSVYWTAAQHDNIVKAAPGNLLGLHIGNRYGSDCYLLLVNSAAGAATPILASYKLTASTPLTVGRDQLGESGMYFSAGITLLMSATNNVYSLGGLADANFDCTAFYK